jgi:hypothetical protein
MDAPSAYDRLAARTDLDLTETSWERALDAVDETDKAVSEMHTEAITYYVGEGQPIGILVEEALRVGGRALQAASTITAALGAGREDTRAGQPARFQELLERRASEQPGGPNTETYRASRLLYLIARQLGGAAALVRRADVVERAFAADDLLEVAAMAWLLAKLIAGAGDRAVGD